MIAQLYSTTYICYPKADGAFSTAWMIFRRFRSMPTQGDSSIDSNRTNQIEKITKDNKKTNQNIYTFRQKFLQLSASNSKFSLGRLHFVYETRSIEMTWKKEFVYLKGMVVEQPQNRLRIKLELFQND